jgi:hypothetical protein
MKRFRLMGLAVLALFALATAVASTTSAFLLENLPEKARTITDKSNGPTLLETVGGTAVECTSAPSTETEENFKPPSGAFHIGFSGCTSKKPVNGLKCTGTGDSAGSILALGSWNLVFDKNPGTTILVTAMLFLLTPLKFVCGAEIVTVEVKGSVLCLHLNPTVSTKTHEFHCVQTKGSQEETRWWNTNGTEGTSQLLTAVNGGAFEQSGQQGLGIVEYSEAVQSDQ